MTNTMTAYSYKRFSSPEQSKGTSRTRQEDATLMLCKKHNWSLDTDLKIDDFGRSAYHPGAQKGLQYFLDAIENGRVQIPSVLVVEKLDRLSRLDVYEAFGLWAKILDKNVWIATVNPEQIYMPSDKSNIHIIFQALIHFALAHEESQKKSVNTKKNWDVKRRKAAANHTNIPGGKLPAWLYEEAGKLKIHDARQKAIQLIYKLSVDGYGARAILKHLNSSGIPNVATGYHRSCKETWNLRYVEAILADRRVIGEHQHYLVHAGKRSPFGNPIPDYYPKIIDETLFYAAQNAKVSRRTLRGAVGFEITNIFQGILFEIGSGQSVRVSNSSKYDKKMGCQRRLTAGVGSCRYEQFETVFLDVVQEVSAGLGDDQQNKLTLETLAIQAQITETEALLRELHTELSIASFRSGIIAMRELDRKIENLRLQLTQTQSALAVHNSEHTISRTVQRLATCSPSERKHLRIKLRSEIRNRIHRINIRFPRDRQRKVRHTYFEIQFKDGERRAYTFETRNGELCRVFESNGDGEQQDPHCAEDGKILLYTYRRAKLNASGEHAFIYELAI